MQKPAGGCGCPPGIPGLGGGLGEELQGVHAAARLQEVEQEAVHLLVPLHLVQPLELVRHDLQREVRLGAAVGVVGLGNAKVKDVRSGPPSGRLAPGPGGWGRGRGRDYY